MSPTTAMEAVGDQNGARKVGQGETLAAGPEARQGAVNDESAALFLAAGGGRFQKRRPRFGRARPDEGGRISGDEAPPPLGSPFCRVDEEAIEGLRTERAAF